MKRIVFVLGWLAWLLSGVTAKAQSPLERIVITYPSRSIASVDYLAELLTSLLARLYGKDPALKTENGTRVKRTALITRNHQKGIVQ